MVGCGDVFKGFSFEGGGHCKRSESYVDVKMRGVAVVSMLWSLSFFLSFFLSSSCDISIS